MANNVHCRVRPPPNFSINDTRFLFVVLLCLCRGEGMKTDEIEFQPAVHVVRIGENERVRLSVSYIGTQHRVRLKTHGVENRRRFSTSKIGVDFRLRKHTWPKKVTTMLLLLQLCIHIVANRNKIKKKCNRNVYLPILHCLQTNQTKTINLNQSQLFLSITCFRKSTSK